jgi:hypothetical protein
MGEVLNDLTDQIFAETGKGEAADKAVLAGLYKTRDEIARAEAGEDEVPAAIVDQGPTYSDLEDDVLHLGEAGELVLQHFNGDERRLGRALALIDSDEGLTASFRDAWRDPQLQADILLIAEKNAREAGIAPLELNQTPRAPSPSPTNVMSWQGRIREMGAQIGTPAFNTPEAQLEWRLLHERIHGGGPIVGQGGRTV